MTGPKRARRLVPTKTAAVLLLGATLVVDIAPALAHHGKDFLLLETDDMPQQGKVYLITSADTNIDADGTRSTELTPGLLFGNQTWAFEPHFHFDRTLDESLHYDATAMEVRYRIGRLGRSGWRAAVSGEVEVPRAGDAHSNGTGRLDFVRTFPRALVAVNLLTGHDFSHDAAISYGIAGGVLTPLANGDRVGLEVLSRLPLHDGIEFVPGYYTQFGKDARIGFKIGLGYYHSNVRSAGTLHLQMTQRF